MISIAYRYRVLILAVFEYKPVVAEALDKVALVKSAIVKSDEVQEMIGQQHGRGDIELVAYLVQPCLEIIFIERHVGRVNHIPLYFIFPRDFSPYSHSLNYIAQRIISQFNCR